MELEAAPSCNRSLFHGYGNHCDWRNFRTSDALCRPDYSDLADIYIYKRYETIRAAGAAVKADKSIGGRPVEDVPGYHDYRII